MVRRILVLVVLGACGFGVAVALAGTSGDVAAAPLEPSKRFSFSATVVRVVSPDTLVARLKGGRSMRVRLIGVEAAGSCSSAQALRSARRLAQGRRVRLVGDRRQPRRDAGRRLLAYVVLPRGADLGLALLSQGHGKVRGSRRGFARAGAYSRAQARARSARLGFWRCARTGGTATTHVPPRTGTTRTTTTGGAATATTARTSTTPTTSTTSTTTSTPVATGVADLTLAHAVFPTPVRVGSILTLLFTVRNGGPGAAADVVVSGIVPVFSEPNAAAATVGVCDPPTGSFRCELGALPPGASVTVTVTVRPSSAGALFAAAQATASSPDPELGNNTISSTSSAVDPPGTTTTATGTTTSGTTTTGRATTAPTTATGATTTAPTTTATPTTTASTATTTTTTGTTTTAPATCHPSYPDFCIPPPPPRLTCSSPAIGGRTNFRVRHDVIADDPHVLDPDDDGIGCER